MKKLLKILILVPVAIFLLFVGLSWSSRGEVAPGLTSDNRLTACPESPNCVSSEEGEVEPLSFSGTADEAWKNLRLSIDSLGGTVVKEEGAYLAATFQTSIFRFVDDMEFRMVAEQQIIHLRSASRVGHSDMGANAARVESLRELFVLSE